MNKYDEYMSNFKAIEIKNKLVEWIRTKMNSFGENSKAIIGISGGKDSTVIAALCAEALGNDRVYGVLMPNGEQSDIEDAMRVVNFLGIHGKLINIKNICKEFEYVIQNALSTPSVAAKINMPPRVRMTTLYMVAQTLGNSFVINTCNLSEDWIGYSTWHGDSAGDFSPLADFTSDEVMAIGDALGLPYDLVHKTPSDGLCGKTDEDNLGFTYYTLNRYIRFNEIDDIKIKNKIDKLHKLNAFKLQPLDKFHFDI